MNILVMTRPEFDSILAEAPTVTRAMLASLVARLGEANHQPASKRDPSTATARRAG